MNDMTQGPGAERLTSDPVDPRILREDVRRLLAVLDEGGIGLVPLDVAYAVLAGTERGIRRIFDVKQRSYDKPSGMFANADFSRELHVMDGDRHAMVKTLIAEVGLPFSVVAPFRHDHDLLARVEPFVLQSSSKAGTLDMLLNAGPFHDEIARRAFARGQPVFGSSANTSLSGSKYRLAEVDAPVREAADIAFDYGRSRHANDEGRSSTIIDFRDFTVIRVGVCFEALSTAFRQRFDVVLRLTDDTAV